MRSRPSSWNTLLATLGLTRRNSSSKSTSDFHRKLRFEQCEDRRMLAVLTVNSLLDNTIGGDGLLTLREAIDDANLNPDADTINFSTDPADGLDGGTITLTQGELSITDSVIIDASMLSSLTVDATGNDPTPTIDNGDGTRIFNITGGTLVDVILQGLTLTGGDVSGSGGAIRVAGANFTLRDSTVMGNAAGSSGGGLFIDSAGTVSIRDSTVSGNTVTGDAGLGGGIALYRSTGGGSQAVIDVVIEGSDISGNMVTGMRAGFARPRGGGISTFNANLRILDSTVTGNSGKGVPQTAHFAVAV